VQLRSVLDRVARIGITELSTFRCFVLWNSLEQQSIRSIGSKRKESVEDEDRNG